MLQHGAKVCCLSLWSTGKLQLITEQIKMLQAQARQVLEEGKRDVMLNHARANFQRRPGLIYHLCVWHLSMTFRHRL